MSSVERYVLTKMSILKWNLYYLK